MEQLRVAIVGAGRMGQGLGLALVRGGVEVDLLGRAARPVVPPLPLYTDGWAEVLRGARIVLIATPDDAVHRVAERLGAEQALGREHVVLHLSGLLDRTVLRPLDRSGTALGSFHPVQTVADPLTAPERLAGAFVGIEGDEPAMEAGERLAAAIGMTPVRVRGDMKPAYHAGATFVANYTAVLAGFAETLARRAGIPDDVARRLYLPLLRGAAENIAALGPGAALTGPVRRGDVRTIATHLGVLEADEQHLYRLLGLEALRLARESGLDDPTARQVEAELSEEP